MIFGGDLTFDDVDYTDFLSDNRQTTRAWAEIERITMGSYAFISRETPQGIVFSGGLRGELAKTDNTYSRYKENQLEPFLETNRGTLPNPDYRDPPEVDPELSFSGPVDKSGWAAELSILQKLSSGLHLWGGWDRVYRYPALDETAAYQGYPLSRPINSDLDPETGHNFEVGLKRFESNWHIGITCFLMRLDDEIAFDETQRLNVNIGNTERRGLEIDALYDKGHYGVRLNGSLVSARSRDGDAPGEMPLVPAKEASFTFWVRPVDSVRLQFHGRYLSDQFQGNDYENTFRKIPAYGIVDLSVEWALTADIRIAAGIDNLFNKNHAVTAYSGGFYPGPGRQFRARIKGAF
jgi:outer membrane receptor protein involved in Fe transport